MADQTDSRQVVADSRADLEGELAHRDEEILRLRDLLIGKDAELGALRGQVAVMEQHSQIVTSILHRVPIPGLRRVIAAFLRRLRG